MTDTIKVRIEGKWRSGTRNGPIYPQNNLKVTLRSVGDQGYIEDWGDHLKEGRILNGGDWAKAGAQQGTIYSVIFAPFAGDADPRLTQGVVNDLKKK
jgi:hypothetical protein